MTPIRFIVPGAPQGKGRPRVGKVGAHARLFTPAKTVAYEGLIAMAGQQAMNGLAPLQGPIRLVLGIWCQIPASWSGKRQRMALVGEIYPTTKPDADNVLKAVGDGLNGICWKDDVQIIEVSMMKRYGRTPQLAVSIEALGEPK